MIKRIRLLFIIIAFFVVASCSFNPNSNKPVEPNVEEYKITLITSYSSVAKNVYVLHENDVFTFPALQYEGYTFKGWQKEGEATIYETYIIKSEDLKELKFIAVWEKDEEVTPTSAREVERDITNIAKLKLVSTFLPRLEAIYAAYLALPVDEQSLVSNIDLLLQMINDAKLLVNAEPVSKMIASIPNDIRLVHEADINEIIANYNQLTEAEQALVEGFLKVANASGIIEAIRTNYEANYNELLLSMPYHITNDYYLDALDLVYYYQTLSAEARLEVQYPDIVVQLAEEINQFDQENTLIRLCVGRDLYYTRDDFGNAWFEDFYKYIYYHGGSALLAKEGINDVNRFVQLAHDYNAGNGQMRYLGNTFASYYLQRELNGVIWTQPDTGYLGFCYQNNRFMDYFSFLARFFAYWRLDEKYANQNNYGADTFVDRWATLVDTCKFFYFDVNTSYVKTARMQDCFNNCSNVVTFEVGDIPNTIGSTYTLPTDLQRRDYVFLGWYDNPNFTGSPIKEITVTSNPQYLYAKWGIDQNQLDIDEAALVDIYIYNLTTTQALVNQSTVGYVMTMYNALTPNAKALVQNTATLMELYNGEYRTELASPVTITFHIVGRNQNSFADLQNAFLNDFNTYGEASISSYQELVTNRYRLMANMSKMFKNDEARAKWGWLLTYLSSLDVARGVRIQANRAINQESGDLEYLCKAISYLFTNTDASGDSEVGVDFSSVTVLPQDTMTITFKYVEALPNFSFDGATYLGCFSDSNLSNPITNIYDGMPTELYLKYQN